MNLDLWSFLLGIVSSILIPFVIFLKNKIIEKRERAAWIQLMKEEYITPILNVAASSMRADLKMSEINRITREKMNMLHYLQEKELPYFSGVNQFYFLRTVVYTNHILGRAQKLSDKHSNKTRNLDKTIYELCKDFKKEVKKYAELKTEFLP